MIVDGSYTPWVRPTRRVHLALSVGMTLTGLILIAAGASEDRGATRPSPLIGQAADTVVGGDTLAPSVLVPAAPFVRFLPPPLAPPEPRTSAKPSVKPKTSSKTSPKSCPKSGPKTSPKAAPKTHAKPHAKPHTKPQPHPRHASPAPQPHKH
jgi:hypothetical protein